eukprot:CAMPEP_0197243840 /NCGR_PEP_ID=MMETSP1429-20130617/9145_1 /TAXON_ID=49237 /ORGANISM="Chaetoceros  sp., Strain UNC1202" /LENGTH=184 /DNA_ID=CAMNT_0042704109 /DNA_START=121 /DNA_END=675 /DNA_ORIENTATION=-
MNKIIILATALTATANAFSTQPSSSTSTSTSTSTTCLSAMNDRRAFFRNAASLAFGAAFVASNGNEASASYSAYANREKDWQERKDSGDIAFSSPKDLKSQLREIAPMNNESSKMFCPNGPSSNVSPLMENKCGDRMAAPSVYGRSDDIVGNSIPGFDTGKYPRISSGSTSLTAEAGGFPKYSK